MQRADLLRDLAEAEQRLVRADDAVVEYRAQVTELLHAKNGDLDEVAQVRRLFEQLESYRDLCGAERDRILLLLELNRRPLRLVEREQVDQ